MEFNTEANEKTKKKGTRKTQTKLKKKTSEGRKGPSGEQGDQKGKRLFLSFLGGVLARIFRVHW